MIINEDGIVSNSQSLTAKQEEISSLCRKMTESCYDLAGKLKNGQLSSFYSDLGEFFTQYADKLQELTYKFNYESNRYKADNEALELSLVNKLKNYMQTMSKVN